MIDRWMDTDKLSWMRDGLGRRCCAYGHVRHFIMLYGRETAEVKVDQLRGDIFTTYQVHTHAFETRLRPRHHARVRLRRLGHAALRAGDPAGARRDGEGGTLREGDQPQRTHDLQHGKSSRTEPPAPRPTQPGWRIESQGPGELILRRMTDPLSENPMPENPYDEANVRSHDFFCHAKLERARVNPEHFTLTLSVCDGPETFADFDPAENVDPDGECSLT